MTDTSGSITTLLQAVRDGDSVANAKLMEVLHSELTRIARKYMRRERQNHTLQPTALVNEAYVRLMARDDARWQNRSHFLAAAAQAMRRILVDYARSTNTTKRWGHSAKLSIDTDTNSSQQVLGETLAAPGKAAHVLALDDALKALAAVDERQARIVELRFFGGLTEAEIADMLHLSTRTVGREWKTARLWLRDRMHDSQ